MSETITQKEQVLIMLAEISNQLEELESIIESSFTGLRKDAYEHEARKLELPMDRLSLLENKEYREARKNAGALKLELGF